MNNEVGNFSVLMSVYKNDNPDYFELALDSVSENQLLKPAEIIIVFDGPVNERIKRIANRENVTTVQLPNNQGLGNALRVGLEKCSYDLVARMDSDDISACERFKQQYFFMNDHADIVACGGNVREFEGDRNNIISTKKMPQDHDKIKKMLKHRSPMSHVTVMFRKKAVLNVGSYLEVKYLEDYFLWIRLIANGYKLANIPQWLVDVRTGEEQRKRRGNKVYISGWDYLSDYMYKNNLISGFDKLINCLLIRLFLCIPGSVKKYIYKFFLRSSE